MKTRRSVREPWRREQPAPQLEMPPDMVKRIKLNNLITVYGPPAAQKDKLIKEILGTCEEPMSWPLTDAQRVNCIKEWYAIAKRIRETVALTKATTPTP